MLMWPRQPESRVGSCKRALSDFWTTRLSCRIGLLARGFRSRRADYRWPGL